MQSNLNGVELPNTCILDISATAKTLYSFHSGLFPVQIADLCSIIEAIVLNDHNYLIGDWRGLPEPYKAVLTPYLTKNILRMALTSQTSALINQPDKNSINLAKKAIEQGLTKSSIDDASYETNRLLNAEAELKAPAISLLRHLHHRAYFLKPKLEHHICDLYGCTREINNIIYETKKTDFFKTPFSLPYREIPPIAFEVFKITKSYDKIVDSIEQVRDKFTPLRNHLYNEWEVMNNPETPITQSSRIQEKLEKDWSKLISASKCIKVSQIKTNTVLLENGPKMMGVIAKNLFGLPEFDVEDEQIKEFIGECLELASSLIPNKFRIISTPVNSYLATPGTEIYIHLSRIFEDNPDYIAQLINKLAFDRSNIYHQQSKRDQSRFG